MQPQLEGDSKDVLHVMSKDQLCNIITSIAVQTAKAVHGESRRAWADYLDKLVPGKTRSNSEAITIVASITGPPEVEMGFQTVVGVTYLPISAGVEHGI